ncbi:ankyrin repeat-containing domain protein [Mycena vulgaris]|nr:ankyrin repeat-containing domain protein [Mycena vulgaris]
MPQDIIIDWNETPLHVFITSQSRNVFTESFDGVTRVVLEYSVTEADIRFRLADCLLLEISQCISTKELDKALEILPDTLFEVYDRFLDKVSPKQHLVYVMAALRWIMFAAEEITLDQLADALSFDFSNPDEYIYDPDRQERNKLAIFDWLEGLVVKLAIFDTYVVLAHSSVKEYALSDHFSTRFGCNLEKNHSYSFIARTCISYFLSVGDHSMPAEPASDPLAKYAAEHWIRHLVLCEDPPALFTQAARVLAEGSGPHRAFCSSRKKNYMSWEYFTSSPLHICCQNGYIEGVEALLATGVDINLAPAEYPRATALTFASDSGHADIVDLLLRNQADPNIPSDIHGCALAADSGNGHIEVVRLLLKSGANANLPDDVWGSPLAAASAEGHIEILRLLLESGADINQPIPVTGWDFHDSALGVACWSGKPEVVHFLLDNGADINLPGGQYGSPLGSALFTRPNLHCASPAAARHGHTEIVHLLLQNGADIDAVDEDMGSPLRCASFHGETVVVRLLIDSGANVNIPGSSCGSPLGCACYGSKSDTARQLLDNGADINLPAGDYGSVLGAAASSTFGTIDERLETLRLLLERGAGVQKHMNHALKLALNFDLKSDFSGNEFLKQEEHRSQVVRFLRERGAVSNSELEGETASAESE